MSRARLVLLVGLAGLGLAAPATAAKPGKTRAKHALAKVEQLSNGKGVHTGRELSPALAQLYAALPALAGDDRRQAEAILARPDDGQADQDGTHKWIGPEAGLKKGFAASLRIRVADDSRNAVSVRRRVTLTR
jgi:hypothetical protein